MCGLSRVYMPVCLRHCISDDKVEEKTAGQLNKDTDEIEGNKKLFAGNYIGVKSYY